MKREKVIVVTGAGSGIGEAIATGFAMQGDKVVIADLNLHAAMRVSDELKQAGCNTNALGMDVSQIDSISSGFASIEQRYGVCDVLINNAGIATPTTLETCTIEEWSRTMLVNVTSAMLCSQQAVRMMRKNQWGRIVNISSISGICASSSRLAYGTSKAAMIGLTRQIAIEAASWGITANAIAPGAIDTPLTQEFHSEATRSSFVQRIPSGQYGQAQDVASAAMYLASDQAKYINGHVLAVDGGFLASGILTAS